MRSRGRPKTTPEGALPRHSPGLQCTRRANVRGGCQSDCQSTDDHLTDPIRTSRQEAQLRRTARHATEREDDPRRPPEPCAQVRILPRAPTETPMLHIGTNSHAAAGSLESCRGLRSRRSTVRKGQLASWVAARASRSGAPSPVSSVHVGASQYSHVESSRRCVVERERVMTRLS
jgi:hypothetical protein